MLRTANPTVSNYLDKPWPRVTWDSTSLQHVAQAVRLVNPHVVYANDESAADYIRSESERMLYRANQPAGGTMCSCGGWQVCFTAGDKPGEYSAWPSVTGYTALRYAKEQQSQPA